MPDDRDELERLILEKLGQRDPEVDTDPERHGCLLAELYRSGDLKLRRASDEKLQAVKEILAELLAQGRIPPPRAAEPPEPPCSLLPLDDIRPSELRFSADRRRAATVYIAREREDRYDDDTYYEIAVWDTGTKAALAVLSRSHRVSYYTGAESGKPPRDVELSPDGRTLVIQYDDGSREEVKLPD
jgi:hypothetical protein